MAVPEEYGGGGNPAFRYDVIVTEATTAGRYSGIGFGLYNDVVAPYLLRLTNEEQKQRWLPQFCTGEFVTAIAMTKPATGSDLQAIKARVVKAGDHYVLNGSKTFITNGINSDLVIVVACTDPDKGAQGFSLLVVERVRGAMNADRAVVRCRIRSRRTPSRACTGPRTATSTTRCSPKSGLSVKNSPVRTVSSGPTRDARSCG